LRPLDPISLVPAGTALLSRSLCSGSVAIVAISEAARLDLYNGLAELLGPDRAETLMAALPIFESSDLVTKTDLALFASSFASSMDGHGSRIDRLDSRMDALDSRMDALDSRMDRLDSRMDRLESAMVGLGLRMDRLFLTLTAGLFVIVAAMVGMFLAVT
jgi:hypothetical protein